EDLVGFLVNVGQRRFDVSAVGDVSHGAGDDVAYEVVAGYGWLGLAVRQQLERRAVGRDLFEEIAESGGHALTYREVLAGGSPLRLSFGAGVVLQEQPGSEGLFRAVTGWDAHARAVDVEDRLGRGVRDGSDAPLMARAFVDGALIEGQSRSGRDGEQRAAGAEVRLVAERLGRKRGAAVVEQLLQEGHRFDRCRAVVGVLVGLVIEDVATEREGPGGEAAAVGGQLVADRAFG